MSIHKHVLIICATVCALNAGYLVGFLSADRLQLDGFCHCGSGSWMVFHFGKKPGGSAMLEALGTGRHGSCASVPWRLTIIRAETSETLV